MLGFDPATFVSGVTSDSLKTVFSADEQRTTAAWRFGTVFVQIYLEGIALTRNVFISDWEGGQDWQVDAHSWSEACANIRSRRVIQRASGNNGRKKHSSCQCCVFQLDKVGIKCGTWVSFIANAKVSPHCPEVMHLSPNTNTAEMSCVGLTCFQLFIATGFRFYFDLKSHGGVFCSNVLLSWHYVCNTLDPLALITSSGEG